MILPLSLLLLFFSCYHPSFISTINHSFFLKLQSFIHAFTFVLIVYQSHHMLLLAHFILIHSFIHLCIHINHKLLSIPSFLPSFSTICGRVHFILPTLLLLSFVFLSLGTIFILFWSSVSIFSYYYCKHCCYILHFRASVALFFIVILSTFHFNILFRFEDDNGWDL